MIMYGVYNVDTLEKLVQMVHKMNNRSLWYERLYAGQVNKWFEMYSASQGANYYAIHSLDLGLSPSRHSTFSCSRCLLKRIFNLLNHIKQMRIVFGKWFYSTLVHMHMGISLIRG